MFSRWKVEVSDSQWDADIKRIQADQRRWHQELKVRDLLTQAIDWAAWGQKLWVNEENQHQWGDYWVSRAYKVRPWE